MQQKIKELLQDKFISLMVKIFLFVMLAFVIIGIWKWQSLPPEIPLFYSLPRSPDQLVKSTLIILLPAIAIIFFCINFILALLFRAEEMLASTLLVTIGTAVSFLLLFTFVKILFLIT